MVVVAATTAVLVVAVVILVIIIIVIIKLFVTAIEHQIKYYFLFEFLCLRFTSLLNYAGKPQVDLYASNLLHCRVHPKLSTAASGRGVIAVSCCLICCFLDYFRSVFLIDTDSGLKWFDSFA